MANFDVPALDLKCSSAGKPTAGSHGVSGGLDPGAHERVERQPAPKDAKRDWNVLAGLAPVDGAFTMRI
jgi:hypothetical protein